MVSLLRKEPENIHSAENNQNSCTKIVIARRVAVASGLLLIFISPQFTCLL